METTYKESEDKTIAIIAYITFIGLIIAFVLNAEKKNEFAKFHIKQMLGLVLMAVVTSFIGLIPFIGWLIAFVVLFLELYMWIVGLLNAINGRMKPLPILGEKFQDWFKGI
ncbi:DUF4870 domain-containing protein [Belliella marina]|uniref:DUF4870 domain-containing protein n=1 Tax=Belliella marina TaxID=1644146 RepID=A0ABW4VIC4_9BACT